MTYKAKLYEILYPLDVIHADSEGAGSVTGSYVSIRDYEQILAVVDVGDLQASATFDFAIYQATDTSGTSAKAISGKSITQLTQADGDGDDLVCINVRAEELDAANNFDCVRMQATVANAAVEFSAVLYGFNPRYMPTPTTNWTETVS